VTVAPRPPRHSTPAGIAPALSGPTTSVPRGPTRARLPRPRRSPRDRTTARARKSAPFLKRWRRPPRTRSACAGRWIEERDLGRGPAHVEGQDPGSRAAPRRTAPPRLRPADSTMRIGCTAATPARSCAVALHDVERGSRSGQSAVNRRRYPSATVGHRRWRRRWRCARIPDLGRGLARDRDRDSREHRSQNLPRLRSWAGSA